MSKTMKLLALVLIVTAHTGDEIVHLIFDYEGSFYGYTTIAKL